MIYTIRNGRLAVDIAARGAELQSIQDEQGTEYLWQGDEQIWPDRALNIFPYVARLQDGTYQYKGQKYQLPIHGFLKNSELEALDIENDSVTFQLLSSMVTRKLYPFDFTLRLQYTLCDSQLRITETIRNEGSEPMYFGLGGHPGFIVPVAGEGEFSDWYLEFAKEAQPVRIGFGDTLLRNGDDVPYPLVKQKILPLTHELFDDDAIILKDMAHKVTLKSAKSRHRITVEYPQMDYLGIWHRPQTAAAYVCIEPWASLPGREGVCEDLTVQPDLISLPAGQTYRNRWTITIRN